MFSIVLVSDFIVYVSLYPYNTFRYSRIIRPFMLVSYSKELRRNCKGILGSGRNIIILPSQIVPLFEGAEELIIKSTSMFMFVMYVDHV